MSQREQPSRSAICWYECGIGDDCIDCSARRAVAKRGDDNEGLSLFIRVAESGIYKGQILLKAPLKEVIFLRLTDLPENDTRIPKWTPWSKDYRKYQGWCYAGQQYLADRVGCVREAANRALKRIVEGRLPQAPQVAGQEGRWHKQYFPDEAFILDRIAELSSASSSASDVNSDGSPSDLGSHAHVTVDHMRA